MTLEFATRYGTKQFLLLLGAVVVSAWLAFSQVSFAKGTTMSEAEFRKAMFVVVTGDVGAKMKGEVKLGDRLVSVNGKPLHNMGELRAVAEQALGKPVVVALERIGDTGLQPAEAEITPGHQRKLGIAIMQPRELILFDRQGGDVTLADSPQYIRQHPDAGNAAPGLLSLKSGTKVLAVSKLRTSTPCLEVFVLEGPHHGEIWFAHADSVKPRILGNGISWIFYFGVASTFFWLLGFSGRRNLLPLGLVLAIGGIIRLVGDFAEPPAGIESLFKLGIHGVSLLCLLIVFGVLIKWSADDRAAGINATPAGILGRGVAILAIIFVPLILLYAFIAGLFRNLGQPASMPPEAAEELRKALAEKAGIRNRRQKNSTKIIEVLPQGARYRGYELRWAIARRTLFAVGASSNTIDSVMHEALSIGSEASYKLRSKAIYIQTWDGLVDKDKGKQRIRWDYDETPLVAAEALGKFLDEVDDALDEPEDAEESTSFASDEEDDDDDGDGESEDDDDFETWLENPEWIRFADLDKNAAPLFDDPAAMQFFSQVCQGRDIAVSNFGLLVSLKDTEAVSEAHSQGGGVVAIIWHGYPNVISQLREHLDPLGYKAVYNDTNQDKVFICKTTDQYACLNLQGHIAYQSARSVVRKFMDWDETYELSLNVCGMGSDWVDAEIKAPSDTTELAEDILRFCPDILEHETNPLAVLIEELKDGRIHLWWD